MVEALSLQRSDAAPVIPGRPYTVGGADEFLAAWIAARLDMAPDDFGTSTCIGIALDDRIIGAVLYNEFRRMERGSSIQASIATTDQRWATRTILREIFYYPFCQLGVTRFWASTAKGNKKARRMLDRLGFRFEGVARRAYDGARDSAVYGMLHPECRWL